MDVVQLLPPLLDGRTGQRCWSPRQPNEKIKAEVQHEYPALTDSCERCASQWCHERTHSITSSAVASRLRGMVRPSAFAVLRLIPRSNLAGCSTGRSAGFAPLRMRSM
jgi:hypothetical protein